MATVKDSITRALKMIGAIATSETPSADEIADGLSIFNAMIGQWSTQNLLIYAKARESFALTSGQQTYTMGPAGDFNTTRPQKIEDAGLEIQTTPVNEFHMEILNQDQFANIQIKSTQSSIPMFLYPEFTYPLAKINLWPVPSAANNLILYSWKPLTTFTDATSTLDLPPGYDEAVHYNLAKRFAPEYGKMLDPNILEMAAESIANLKRMNVVPLYLDIDQALKPNQRLFNWLRGE